MLVWVFLNAQRIVRIETEIPYPLFALIGTTVWASFTSTITAPLASFVTAKPVFSKIKVPPEAFVLSGFYRAVFDLVVRILILVPVFFVFRFTPPATAYLFPIAVLSLLVMGFAIGLMLIPVGALYGDVGNAVATFMGLLMYSVPVVFPIPEGEGILRTVMSLNPLTPAVSLCRETITSGDLSLLPATLGWLGASVVVVIFAFLFIRISMPHLIARMGM